MIKRFVSFLGALAFAAPLAFGQTSTWVPDKAHSEVTFSILHMGLANVRGRFGNIGGAIVWNEADITKSTVNGPIPGMDHKPHSGFAATTTVNRTDFGIGTNFPAAVVGEQVKLAIDLDVAKQ